MSARLPDEVRLSRLRESVRNASARRRKRMEHAGKSALTVWVDAGLKAALTTTAAERGTTIADTAEALLSAALTPSIPDPSQQPRAGGKFQTSIPDPERVTLTTAERDQRIRELHKTGMNNCEIGRQIGCNEATVRRALKRMETHQ